MGLLTPGYWPSNYWPSNYWPDDYWANYGVSVPPVAPSIRTIVIESEGDSEGMYPSTHLVPYVGLYPGASSAPSGRTATIGEENRTVII